ncbi:peptidylprolyl isomerase [Methanocella sp. CWC-04]|uniref:Peptidyl-prolyl cis-trans isomerase n=1 Tax=Methanooceanicella nereidis TaxID=2052831 RepID=A0AAP2W660_9EURY|nr:peptidylprolyl isomerase [Methanocella sp. CWC-04]MCD1293924.1 peptidylprolyl isomerase [Methanocella sp. CWC-04]
MAVQKGDYIKLSFTGKLQNGTIFDTTDANVAKEYGLYNENAKYGPQTVIVGKGFIVPGLDEDLIGQEIGKKTEVTLPPEKGFGIKRLELIETVPVKKFKEPVRPGMRVTMGQQTGMVESVAGGRARINFNSPLAGETLTYQYEVDSIIEGKEERIAATLEMYTGRDIEYSIDGDRVIIEVPKEFTFNQRWGFAKSAIAAQIMELENVNAVIFQETYKKEEAAPEAEVAAEEQSE